MRENKKKKPKKGSLIRRLSQLFSFVVFIILLIGFGFIYYGKSGPLQEQSYVTINRGDGLSTIAGKLAESNVISTPLEFKIAAILSNKKQKLQAGTYEFQPEITLRDVIEKISTGKVANENITFAEGLTSLQMLRIMKENEFLDCDLNVPPSEGSLLPNTYSIPIVEGGYSCSALIARMQQDMRKSLTQAWENRDPDLPISSPEELLILASIVEKETGVPSERARVASVFVNRLIKGMRLQSDPTIIYGLVGGEGKLGRGILRSEIRAPTPYNTYTIDGLPPTPIANPGIESLNATANPAATNDIFFVADGSGGHVFSETLSEHQENVKKWREIEKEKQE